MSESFGDIACETDLASKIAAEIMGLKWTHTETGEEQCQRHGQLQEIVAKHLAASQPPPAGAAGGGSGDLGALSAGATPGLCAIWPNSPLYLRDETRNGWGLFSNHHRTNAESGNNANFVKELWNAYRSGRLIEAPTLDLGVQGGWQAGGEAMREAAAAHLRTVADAMEANCRGDLGTMFAAQSASDIRRQAKRVAELEIPTPPSGVETIRQGNKDGES